MYKRAAARERRYNVMIVVRTITIIYICFKNNFFLHLRTVEKKRNVYTRTVYGRCLINWALIEHIIRTPHVLCTTLGLLITSCTFPN
jgi:hypothetical protein